VRGRHGENKGDNHNFFRAMNAEKTSQAFINYLTEQKKISIKFDKSSHKKP
jgi:hypothetical protein